MNEHHQRLISQLCARLKDDTVDMIVKATMSIEVKCGLSEEQGKDVVAPILASMVGDVVKASLDLCIELVQERERDQQEQQR